MKKHAWAIGFTACLTAFTVFMGLDTFVLSSAYQTNATQINTDMIRQAEGEAAASAKTTSETDPSDTDTSTVDAVAAASEKTENSSKEAAENSVSADGSDQSKKDTESTESTGNSSGSSKKSGGHRRKPGSGSAFGRSSSEPGAALGKSSGKSGGGSGSGSSHSGAGTGGSSFDAEEAAKEAAEVTTENAGDSSTYEDENIKISYTQYESNGTTIHVADVQLSSVEYLKTAFAQDTYGKNVTESTSDMAEANNAVLAVNGDYYGVQEKGYVIRNGVVYRDKAGTEDVLCIYADGSMKIIDPSTVTAQELVEQGVWQAFSFGPGLVENGGIAVSLDSEVGKAKASNPRTAIGMIDELHYVFVVSDGRTDESEGLSLYELASFMEQLGVQTAYNLDGGGSSTMVFQGEIVNNPTGGFGDREREVSDIVYIG